MHGNGKAMQLLYIRACKNQSNAGASDFLQFSKHHFDVIVGGTAHHGFENCVDKTLNQYQAYPSVPHF